MITEQNENDPDIYSVYENISCFDRWSVKLDYQKKENDKAVDSMYFPRLVTLIFKSRKGVHITHLYIHGEK